MFQQRSGLHRAVPTTAGGPAPRAGAAAPTTPARRPGRPALRAPLWWPSGLLVLVLLAAVVVSRGSGDAGAVGEAPLPVEVRATVFARLPSPADAGRPTTPPPGSTATPDSTAAQATPAGTLASPQSTGEQAGPAGGRSPSAAGRPAAVVVPPADGAASPPPLTNPPAGAVDDGYCSYQIQSHSSSDRLFSTDIAVGNTSGVAWNGWRATVTVTPAPKITEVWGASASSNGTNLTLTPADYNRTAQNGEVRTIGFLSDTSGAATKITDFTVDGHRCTELPS